MTFVTRAGSLLRELAGSATRLSAGLRGHTIDIDGFTIGYDEGGAGRGETVLMLHGFSADRDVWRRFAVGLKDHHVLIPDLPGHGRTPFIPGANYSMPAQADRMVALLDALGIARVHVIGNSMGGFLAATLARRAPDRVISLALFDAAGVTSPQASPLGRMLDAGRNPFLMDHPSQFDEFFAMTMARQPFVPKIVKRALAADYVERRQQLEEIFADFNAGPDMLDQHLAEIPAPAWVAWGRQDQLLDVSAATVYGDGLPRASVTVYDDLGHMPMIEAPRRAVRDYRAFLDHVAQSA